MSLLAGLVPTAGELLVAGGGVVLQGAGEVNQPNVAPSTRAAGGLVFTLIVGAILLAAAPNYVDALVEDVTEEPVASFVWGVLVFIGFFVVAVLLAITVIGIVLVIPLVIALVIVAIVGNVLAFIAVGEQVVDSRWMALLVAAVVIAVLNFLPVVGNLISFAIGAVGLGAVVRHWYN